MKKLLPVILLAVGIHPALAEPIPIKVVVVSMFEHGSVSGDRPGEFQFWVDRMPLDTTIDFPAGEYELRMNDDGVLGICTGGGIPNATASIMALGMDDRFDLSKAYWVVAGIAGGDPADITLGGAAWARYVIDGDLLFEIDAREIPDDWPYGIIPLGGSKPAKTKEDMVGGWSVDTISFELNHGFVDWAYNLTKDIKIPVDDKVVAFRQQFSDQPAARGDPRVMIGDTLSASTYWHGNNLNNWANDWVRLHSDQEGNYVTTNMEDSGTLTALHRLARIGRADASRVLVLRTASNFSVPPPGESATWSATAEYPDRGLSALESAYSVGSTVVNALVNNWEKYSRELPQ